MILEKDFAFNPEKEKEPTIIIKRSSEAPADVKENPFYDPGFWGRANSPDDIYIPDSDEAISFAMAAHEIGHLVNEDERNDASLDNFEATRAEEERAWEKGWQYLQKYLSNYYKDKPEIIHEIETAFEKIKELAMQATDLSEDMYLEKGSLDHLNHNEISKLIKDKRETFFSKKGDEFKELFEKLKEEKIGIKPDWDKFSEIVRKAVEDIFRDNKKRSSAR